MSVMHSAARTVRSGSPNYTQTVSRTTHSRGISVLFRSRTTSYQPPFTPESIDNSTRPDGSGTFNCSALAGTLLMCASHCVNVSISSFRWILGLICNRDLFSKNKSGFATCYHVKLLLIFRKYRKRYFLHNKKSLIADLFHSMKKHLRQLSVRVFGAFGSYAHFAWWVIWSSCCRSGSRVRPADPGV